MINKIKDHISIVLSDKKYDKEFKKEMMNMCISEYENAIENGFSKMDAYDYALKDFNKEYAGEYLKKINPINIKMVNLISVIISIMFVCSYVICSQLF